MEVHFLDVGQGTSQILLLGSGRAIVIDAGGATDSPVLQALSRYYIHTISRLIISHNHADHVGGALSLLKKFEGSIEEIWVVRDDKLCETPFWAEIERQLEDKTLHVSQFRRLEREKKAKLIFSDRKLQANVWLYSPYFSQNIQAQQTKTPNATCAILCLKVGKQSVLFSGDSELSQWQQLRASNNRRLKCSIFSVPHHGGRISGATDQQIQWLFGKAIQADYGVISVGTSNSYNHPREEVVSALRQNGAIVVCTQITKKCHPDLESLRPGVLAPQQIGRSSATKDRTQAENSRNLACMGTVVANITPDQVSIARIGAHQQRVDELRDGNGCPLCR